MNYSGLTNKSSCGLVVFLLVGLSLQSLTAEETSISYNRDIRPILASRCFTCHGLDAAERKGDLRLDTNEAVGEKGVIKPGKADESELLVRLTSTDPDLHMPPAASKKPELTAEEIELVRQWVNQGANYDAHWAFIPPVRPELPSVEQPAWPQGAIDKFLLASMEREGFTPAVQADPRTLVRRLSFDLRGLPPTAEEVAQFERDPSPAAWEALVDKFLKSPQYGERMASYWLDVVRFADTGGYHSDNPRNISPYRDYVISAFNNNLPYDQFAREQIAGDLLPEATLQQKVASGYNRLLQTTEEGGAQAKEYTAKYSADRVRNFGAGWLALTTGCCECHNHKFDPLSIKDFYSLAAFFADIQEAALGRREPGMPVPTTQHTQALAALEAQIATQEAELKSAAEKLTSQAANDENLQVGFNAWKVLSFGKLEVKGDQAQAKLVVQDDGSLQSTGKIAPKEVYELTALAVEEATTCQGIRLEALADDAFPAQGPGTAHNGNFVMTQFKAFVLNQDGKERPIKITAAEADHSQAGFDISTTINKGTGWAILPHVGQSHEAIFKTETTQLQVGEQLKLLLEFHSPHPEHSIGRLRLSTTSIENPAKQSSAAVLAAIAATPVEKWSKQEKEKLTKYYETESPLLQTMRADLQKLSAELKKLDDRIPKTLISISGKPRTVRILARGDWLDDSGEMVQPAIPVSFVPTGWKSAEGAQLGRLDLADWLLHQNNPLTARVFVNRLWKLTFGRGIVRTLDDFGTQGELPTHPELLDWLAVEFRESGWDVKHLLKLMVMSQAYRQSSVASAKLLERDPRNRWFARQNRFRIEAEMVRDNALAVSGLLVEEVGGESVKPYQPAGYWQHLNFPKREWTHDKGPDLYRRGVYTFWQRSFLHPSLAAFDAPSREECVVERTRSNTPQQALALLNDPTYVEASRVLAAQVLQARPKDDNVARLQFIYSRVLQREPRPAEQETLLALVAKQQKQYQADPSAAEHLLKTGDAIAPSELDKSELAAWTNACRVVINLHETITRN